jgi:signal transduction histidine kinase
MKLGIRWRLGWYVTAIVLVALAIGWSARTTWKEARQLQHRLESVQVESFRIADSFQATMLDLNSYLRDYQATRNLEMWQKFFEVSEAMDHWIDVQTAWLTNPKEKSILNKINDAYDIYRKEAHQITNVTWATTDSLRLSRSLEAQAKALFRMGNELADAHRERVSDLVSNTQRSLPRMQQMIFGLLLVLLSLGAWVAVVVYRDMIAPLRVTLVETRELMERQEKLASLGVLAAGVAHEIRNPLTAIKARLFTQRKRLVTGSPEAEDAAVINREIDRLERIVKDVLQFARPADPNLVRVLAEIPVREVCELMAPQLEKSGINLRIDLTAPAMVEVDLLQIKQVLINLIQNAAESIGHDGTVTLRVRLGSGRLRNSPSPSVVIIEIEDTGHGISPEVQKRLFDPFFTTKESGTGLGLAIAARIVEKHGGDLEFQTAPNRGTIFGVVLPHCQADESASANFAHRG